MPHCQRIAEIVCGVYVVCGPVIRLNLYLRPVVPAVGDDDAVLLELLQENLIGSGIAADSEARLQAQPPSVGNRASYRRIRRSGPNKAGAGKSLSNIKAQGVINRTVRGYGVV